MAIPKTEASRTFRHVLRFTVEAFTPLSISTGLAGEIFDNALVRDANGLPTIPGPSMAGALRACFSAYFGEAEAKKFFGYEEERSDNGLASRLDISFGYFHDAQNHPVEGLLLEDRERLRKDPVLALGAREAPVKRDHVAINHRGVARRGAKFDRTSAPTGSRFSFEIGLWGNRSDIEDCKKILELLVWLIRRPEFRLGGAARRGLGRVEIVKKNGCHGAQYACFDMTNEKGREDFVAYRDGAINETGYGGFGPVEVMQPDESKGRHAVSGTLKLEPVGLWRFGAGAMPFGEMKDSDIDMLPLSEEVIVYYSNGEAIIEQQGASVPILASGIKGALVHRAEYHYRCAVKCFSDDCTDPDALPRYMDALFGAVKNKDSDAGQAGYVLIDDAYVRFDNKSIRACNLQHNSIDRFSQGVRHGALFSEQALLGGEIKIRVTVLTRSADGSLLPKRVRDAFKKALDDLCKGDLAIGARGHGFCTGIMKWDDNGAWLNEIKDVLDEKAA